jgi:CRISPR-associated endonuclease/helicase Cas3
MDNKHIEQFTKAFHALTTNPPFPWQTRLYEALATNNLPDQLDIPTGLGKTSIIPLWLLAHLLGNPAQRPPMRLVYVVNRRTIVDQASDIARQLWEKEDGTPTVVQELWKHRFPSKPKAPTTLEDAEETNCLSVSTLRGALADNRQWMRYPHRPAIIIGTVDMIGSRLLFDAYRAGKWTKAMHAGLLGQDSLLVHDEAHLTDPFQQLLEWITRKQSPQKSLRPMQLLAMSATGSTTGKKTLQLDDQDLALNAVKIRIHAAKRLKLHPSAGKAKLIEELTTLAAAYDGSEGQAKKVIVFVREPKTAKAITESLHKNHKVETHRIALLTGTLRGYERDQLVNTHVLKTLLGTSTETMKKSLFLISTSAGEVGADFDADHLICDLAPLDSMIQRLGRVNRKGSSKDSDIHVLLDLKATDKLEPFQKAAVAAGEWLAELPLIENDPDARRNASPQTLREQRLQSAKKYQAACSPELQTITPHPATLDAWALTSIQEDWPLAPKLDDYLHGLRDYEPPRASLAWREELSLFFPFNAEAFLLSKTTTEERRKQFDKWFDLCPLHPRELVGEKAERIMAALAAVAERHPHAPLVEVIRQKVIVHSLKSYTNSYLKLEKNRQKNFHGLIRDHTFILPAKVGGLSTQGLIDESADYAVEDVADAVVPQTVPGASSTDPVLPRLRISMTAGEDGLLSPQILGKTLVSLNLGQPPEDASKGTLWRDSIKSALVNQHYQMKPVYHQRFDSDEKTAGILMLFKPVLIRKEINDRVPLNEHNTNAANFAGNFTDALDLPHDCIQAIKIASSWHDLGKDRDRWQISIKNLRKTDPDYTPLAKSFGKGMNVEALAGYRHEFGSLIDVANQEKGKDRYPQLLALPESQRELILHLIAAHHGRGRPFFPADTAFDPDDPAKKDFGLLLAPAEIARRYARLQRTYGHWGLAYLESLVMCADHAASRGEEPEDTQ